MTGLSHSALELMRRHVDALFTHDTMGRLVTINDGQGGAPPRFFLGRTREGCLWRCAASLPASVAEELERVVRDEPPLESTNDSMPLGREEYIRILAAGSEVQRVWAGPCYSRSAASSLAADTRPEHEIRLIDRSNIDLLGAHMGDWTDVALLWQPMVVALENGSAVSVCGSVRMTVDAHEAGVDTAPAFRRRGFARSAVAGWLAAVNRIGVEPLYSTSWENEASQRLAATLGLTMFGVDFHVT